MRDRHFWEKWLRANAESIRPQVASIRDWFRAAGVQKGERRHFKAALKSLEGAARAPEGGRFRRRPGEAGPREDSRGSGPRGRPGAPGGLQEGGRLRLTREGRPIVVPDVPDAPAIRIPRGALGGAWPKDRVLVRLERRRGGAPPYGRIVRVVERGIREFVGRFAPAADGDFVRFRDREADLCLPVDVPEALSPEPGDLVLAEVAEYPGGGREGRARVLRVLGQDHTMETIALSVVAARGIPAGFSDEAAREAAAIPQSVRVPAGRGPEGALRRIDLRDLPFVTIDGDDARDFDDAVCLVQERGDARLLVAIADVSHYVTPGSAIDRDAYRRGTSVYFPDRCLPMLPQALSEGVCSLKPGVNRLAMTVDIPVNAQGRPGPPSFYPSVIRSRARLTYGQVHDFLDRPGEAKGAGRLADEVGSMLRRMEALAGVLSLVRAGRGALDFDIPEARIVSEDGLPRSVDMAPRWESHRLIEEFMLLANTAVAEFLSDRGYPFLLRIHEPPAEDRIVEFEDAAARLLRRSRVTERRDPASRLRKWAEAARGGKYERAIHMLLLRSLMLARYAPERAGHFGLALPLYTHFTSPIRRYPDLIVHRALKAALGEASLSAYVRTVREEGAAMGIHLSDRERAATDAERDVEQRAKALYISSRRGETFTGVISSVTGYGFFVELLECFVEGYVRIDTLRDDDYRFSTERGEWFGVLRKTRLGLGDRVRVRVHRADVDRGEIDLQLIERIPDSPAGGPFTGAGPATAKSRS